MLDIPRQQSAKILENHHGYSLEVKRQNRKFNK